MATDAFSTDTQAWFTAPRKDLVAHLVNDHHAYARAALARLGPLLRAALEEESRDYPELSQVTVFFCELELDLLAHFKMEEQQLFPAILAMDEGGDAPAALGTPQALALAIQAEHQSVEELSLNLRMVTSDFELPEDASGQLKALYQGFKDLEDHLQLHLYLENHILFPQVLPDAAP